MPNKEIDEILLNFDLNKVPSHLLRRAHFKAEEIFAHTFQDKEITPRQKAALILIYQAPGISQKDLSKKLAMDRNTVAEMVRRMVERKLITRRQSAEDARAYELFICNIGVELLEYIMPMDTQLENRVMAKIPKEHQAIFMECLRLIAEN